MSSPQPLSKDGGHSSNGSSTGSDEDGFSPRKGGPGQKSEPKDQDQSNQDDENPPKRKRNGSENGNGRGHGVLEPVEEEPMQEAVEEGLDVNVVGPSPPPQEGEPSPPPMGAVGGQGADDIQVVEDVRLELPQEEVEKAESAASPERSKNERRRSKSKSPVMQMVAVCTDKVISIGKGLQNASLSSKNSSKESSSKSPSKKSPSPGKKKKSPKRSSGCINLERKSSSEPSTPLDSVDVKDEGRRKSEPVAGTLPTGTAETLARGTAETMRQTIQQGSSRQLPPPVQGRVVQATDMRRSQLAVAAPASPNPRMSPEGAAALSPRERADRRLALQAAAEENVDPKTGVRRQTPFAGFRRIPSYRSLMREFDEIKRKFGKPIDQERRRRQPADEDKDPTVTPETRATIDRFQLILPVKENLSANLRQVHDLMLDARGSGECMTVFGECFDQIAAELVRHREALERVAKALSSAEVSSSDSPVMRRAAKSAEEERGDEVDVRTQDEVACETARLVAAAVEGESGSVLEDEPEQASENAVGPPLNAPQGEELQYIDDASAADGAKEDKEAAVDAKEEESGSSAKEDEDRSSESTKL